MSKATKFTMYLAGFIILLFTTGMLMTFANDALQASGFFGDKVFVPYKKGIGEYMYEVKEDGQVDTGFTWGARHYWYHVMCVLLFILSIARIVIWVNFYWSEKKEK